MSGDEATGTVSVSKVKERGRSTIEFPYFDLASALEVAAGVRAFGTNCDWVQLATQLKQAANGGGFRQRVMAARSFGFLEYERGRIGLTDLGIKTTDPKYQKRARVEAFLNVPLFGQMYEHLKGHILPPVAAVEKMMVDRGVAPKQKDKARQVFMRSAQQAGFRDLDQDRLVAPSLSDSPQTESSATSGSTKNKRTGGGDGGGYPTYMEVLLDSLPEKGADWSIDARITWLQAASKIFDLVFKYPGSNEPAECIAIEKTKAG